MSLLVLITFDKTICMITFLVSLETREISYLFNDTHREKGPSDKTPALTESTNMGIWVVGTTNQLFIRGS